MTPMEYREYAPALELRPWVGCYWTFHVHKEAGPVEHWVPPDGGIQIAIKTSTSGQAAHAGGRLPTTPLVAAFVGPRTEPLTPDVRAGDVYWGIRFWPGAGSSVARVEAKAWRDRVVPMTSPPAPAILGKLGATLAPALAGAACGGEVGALDACLVEFCRSARPLDSEVMAAVFEILRSGGTEPVSGLASKVGLSPRQLRRRFSVAVGLTPKELSRVHRLRATAIAAVAEEKQWIEVAAENGYADQAHLVNEFQRLVGLSPERFRRQARHIRHGELL